MIQYLYIWYMIQYRRPTVPFVSIYVIIIHMKCLKMMSKILAILADSPKFSYANVFHWYSGFARLFQYLNLEVLLGALELKPISAT